LFPAPRNAFFAPRSFDTFLLMNGFIALLSAFTLAPIDASERYLDCLGTIEDDLELGRRAAQIWAAEGGGANAQHCLAMADSAAGFSKLGAARLETIAQRKDAGDDLIRARLYAQAAEAWLDAEKTDAALTALNAAFEHAPEAGELYLTAAKIHAFKEQWQEAAAAVNEAEKAGFASADAYIARGRANLALGNPEAAAEDVVSALSIEPTNINALTLRGDVQRAGVVIEVSLSAQQ
jgi:tetratricopeptide (TPR) repeat protein